MADLLECLLQIKGLRETADRIATLVRRPAAARALEQGLAVDADRLLARLADTEVRYGRWLRLMLESECPRLPHATEETRDQHGVSATTYLDRVLAERAANLEILDRCSAQDLARRGARSDGSTIIVADVVAFMLAADVDILGELRRALAAL